MTNKRTTIYDLAKAMNLSASYISKALNNHPSVREEIREKVRAKAKELNYSHNSYAANLRRGSSKTIGVIVPYIRRSFFAKAIAGIEEVCTNNGYGVIICQSQDSFERECHAIKTLIRQNVDAIFISQPFNGRAIKAGITKARGTDTWTIFQGDATNEIYLNDHEWTAEETEALMTPDELIVLAETFVMRLESMFPGYMRLQPAEGGFTADLTYTDDVSGAPSPFMTGVKDYKWTELASWENRFQFIYEL